MILPIPLKNNEIDMYNTNISTASPGNASNTDDNPTARIPIAIIPTLEHFETPFAEIPAPIKPNP